jgi:DnaJ-class molecular chaperone
MTVSAEELWLEAFCTNCNGEGKVKGELGCSGPPPMKDCPECEGHGCVLTATGEKLLDFIKRRLVIDTNTKVGFK